MISKKTRSMAEICEICGNSRIDTPTSPPWPKVTGEDETDYSGMNLVFKPSFGRLPERASVLSLYKR